MGILALLPLLASAATLGSGSAAHGAATEAQADISLDGCQLTSSAGISHVTFGGTRREYPGLTRLDLDTVPGIETTTTIEVGAGTAVETFQGIDCGHDEHSDAGDEDGGEGNGGPGLDGEPGTVDEPVSGGEQGSEDEDDGSDGVPGGGGDGPGQGASLEEIQERCEKLDFELTDADLIFEPDERMILGVASEVEAHIVLDEGEFPETAIDGDGVTRIRVSCKVEARLRGGEFSIDDDDWREENLLTASSVSWSWFVTPARLGQHRMTLEVRPVLLLDDTELTGTTHPERRTVEVVDSGFGARLMRWLRQTTEVLRTFEGLLLSMAAVLVAVAGLLASMWWRKREVPRRRA